MTMAGKVEPVQESQPPVGPRVALPEKFGDYLLTSYIGRGGLAEVFRAHRVDDPTRSPLALKRLLRPDQEGIARLLEEARLGQTIEDSHLVKVLEQGTVGNKPYLVMELVDGVDLATIARRLKRRQQAFPTEVVIALMLEIARGLQALHQQRNPDTGLEDPVVHSDIKPSNILIGRDGVLRLADLGLARRVREVQGGIAESVAGTLAYMAPERLTPGSSTPLSPQSDLFSLGIIGFELCTMRSLFSGAPQRMMQQLLSADRFIALAMEQMPDYIHPRLKSILGELLQANPARRPSSAHQVIVALTELRERLRLPVDLAHFVAPYIGFDPMEDVGERVTAHWPKPPKAKNALKQARADSPITHLRIEQLTEMLKRPNVIVADPGMMARNREAKQQQFWMTLGGFVGLFLMILLAVYAATPVAVKFTSNPLGAMVYIQHDCEGAWEPLQPTPFVYHPRESWPFCIRMTALGYISETTRLYKPSFFNKNTASDLALFKEVCVEVDSKPTGLPIYVQYTRRGTTGPSTTRVCGLQPGIPYVIQLEYRGVRWDVDDIQARAGESVAVFHDFGGSLSAKSTPMQRCERYFKGKQYQRAIEICRVAVTEATTYQERINALIVQSRAYVAQNNLLTGCDTLHSALGTAVEYRDVELEQQVQDWRARFSCGPLVRLAAAQPDEEARAATEAAAQPDSGGAPAAAGAGAAAAAGGGGAASTPDKASAAPAPGAGGSGGSREVLR
ncbi:MAG: serine/threonine-protein kinase [Myxococcota bacterium]